MTTNPQPAPYDAEIEANRVNLGSQTEERRLQAARIGYLRAKAEDADLLTVAEQLVFLYRPGGQKMHCWMCQLNGVHLPTCLYPAIEAAIARARGGTP